MDISVVVPSRNRPRLLEETVESVLAGDEVPAEIVIVDQSDSPHPRLASLEHDSVVIRYVRSSSRGPSRGRNEGIAHATCEAVAFVDDDELVAREWLRAFREALTESAARTALTGRVVAYPAEAAAAFVPSPRDSRTAATFSGRLGDVDALCSGNMCVRRSAFTEVGLFDERLRTAEDNDLGFRLLEAGYAIRFVPEAVVYHRAWRTRNQAVPLLWQYGIGQGAFYAKHFALRDRYMLRRLGWSLRRSTRNAAASAVRANPRTAVAEAAYAAGLLWGFGRRIVGRAFAST